MAEENTFLSLSEARAKWGDIVKAKGVLNGLDESSPFYKRHLDNYCSALENTATYATEEYSLSKETLDEAFGEVDEAGVPTVNMGALDTGATGKVMGDTKGYAMNPSMLFDQLLRRGSPLQTAMDLCGVQSMRNPTTNVYSVIKLYGKDATVSADAINGAMGLEAQFKESNTAFGTAEEITLNAGGGIADGVTLKATGNVQLVPGSNAKELYKFIVPAKSITDNGDANTKYDTNGTFSGEKVTAGEFVYFVVTSDDTDLTTASGNYDTWAELSTALDAGTVIKDVTDQVLNTFSADVELPYDALTREELEQLGTTKREFDEMTFAVKRTTVQAQGRGLKTQWSNEFATDARAVHGLDVKEEMNNLLSTELNSQTNRHIIRSIVASAVKGGKAQGGKFDLDVDAKGRWLGEKLAGLMFQVEKENNAINYAVKRGKGNFVLVNNNVASGIDMAGSFQAFSWTASGGDTTGTGANGRTDKGTKVVVDPYSNVDFACAGFKGESPMDAGMFYCPYVNIERYEATHPDTVTPIVAYKTRYGLVSNPFAEFNAENQLSQLDATGKVIKDGNAYYRKFAVANL